MKEARRTRPADRRAVFRRLLLAGLGGCLVGLAFPNPGWGPLVIPGFAIALGLAASALPGCGARSAGEGAVFGFVATLLTLRWFATPILLFSHLGALVAWLAVLLSAATLGVLWGVLFSILSFFARRRGEGMALLMSPPLLCAYDLVRERFPFPFPWGSAAPALARWEGIPALTAGVGSAGVSFLLYSLSALIAGLFLIRRRRLLVPAVAWILIVSAALIVGWLTAPPTAGQVRIAALQGSLPRDASPEEEWSTYSSLTGEAARAGATIVVWPESAVSYTFDAEGRWGGLLSELAAKEGVDLIVGGLTRSSSGRYENSAVLVRADLGMVAKAPKRQLVPFGEYMPLRLLLGSVPALAAEVGDFEPGREVVVFDGRQARLGPLVCFEAVFPGLSRDLVRHGAALLVNQTNDSWFGTTGGPRQHLDHAILRSAETGRPLVRAANSGISAIVVGGRVAQELPTGAQGFLVADLGLPDPAHVPPGAAAGRVIAWGALALTLLAVAGIVPRRRESLPVPERKEPDHA